MMWWIIGISVAVAAGATGAFAAFIRHRREKARRPPHAFDRSMWNGT